MSDEIKLKASFNFNTLQFFFIIIIIYEIKKIKQKKQSRLKIMGANRSGTIDQKFRNLP